MQIRFWWFYADILTNEPEYLAQCFRQENINGNIVLKNIKLDLYRKSFVFRGSLLWNKLPDDIKKEQRIRRFKEKRLGFEKCWKIFLVHGKGFLQFYGGTTTTLIIIMYKQRLWKKVDMF